MLSEKERADLIENADRAISKVCKKYGVILTISSGEIAIHHGDWHDSGDYSVREVTLNNDVCL